MTRRLQHVVAVSALGAVGVWFSWPFLMLEKALIHRDLIAHYYPHRNWFTEQLREGSFQLPRDSVPSVCQVRDSEHSVRRQNISDFRAKNIRCTDKVHQLSGLELIQNHCKMACFDAEKYPPYQISVLKKKWCRNQDSNSRPTDYKLNYGNFNMGSYSAVRGSIIPDCTSPRYYSLIKIIQWGQKHTLTIHS